MEDLIALINGLSIAAQLWVVLMLSIAIHEIGHWWVARLLGMRVERVQIGTDWKHKVVGSSHEQFYGTQWKFSWLPVAGYVVITGLGKHPALRALPDHDFRSHRIGSRIAVLMAGVLNQLAFAMLCMMMLALIDGGGVLHGIGAQLAMVWHGLQSVWGVDGAQALLQPGWDLRRLVLCTALFCLMQCLMQLIPSPKLDLGQAIAQLKIPRADAPTKKKRMMRAAPLAGNKYHR